MSFEYVARRGQESEEHEVFAITRERIACLLELDFVVEVKGVSAGRDSILDIHQQVEGRLGLQLAQV